MRYLVLGKKNLPDPEIPLVICTLIIYYLITVNEALNMFIDDFLNCYNINFLFKQLNLDEKNRKYSITRENQTSTHKSINIYTVNVQTYLYFSY